MRKCVVRPGGRVMFLLLLLVSTILSITASAVLGVRLLRLATRTRELPELMIGCSFVLSGVIGYVIMLAGNPANGAVAAATAERLFFVGYSVIGLGVCCIYVFIWRTFRLEAKWASWLAMAGIFVVLGTSDNSTSADQARGAFFWLGVLGRAGAGFWAASESFLWWSRMRRRLELGLADPVICNRFLIWGLASASTASIFLGTTFIMPTPTTGAPAPVNMPVVGIIFISSITIFTAAVQWLAFFPPERYLHWLQANAAGDSA